MASIRNLKDNGGNVFYPLTHERAVKDSNGVSLDTKLSGLESKSYIEAWDGASTPVVANIPAGVIVTYNTTTYTGTLAASADTIGKIYLVKNGSNYDRYITSQSGSTYSWAPNGTTAMDLYGYATDAELNQLEAKVTDLYGDYIENPEWIRVITDSEGKVLYGIKSDGTQEIITAAHFRSGISVSSISVSSISVDRNLNINGYSIENADNDGCVKIDTDQEDRVLGFITEDGTEVFNTDKRFRGVVSFEGGFSVGNRDGANGLKESVSSKLSSINALNPFEYYRPRLLNMGFPKKNTNTKPLVLCHISDIHGEENQFNRIVEFLNLYGGLYDDVILTGDIVAAQFGDSISFLNAYDNKALLVIGNHDAWERNASPIVIVPAKDDYDKFIAPFASSWGITQPNDAAIGKCYYYKDYPNSKIRLIVADCMHDSQDQTDFIEAALAGAITNDYSVIMSQHYPASDIIPSRVPFQSIDIDGTGFEANPAYIGAVDTFINNGGKFICWLCGHHHVDLFGYIVGHPNQLQICIDCARLSSDFDTSRIPGTKSQDVANFYSFDVETGTFSILRVGATFDRRLQKKDSLIVDYINKIIL